jgi:SAM-dependent methyltransferase
MRHPSGQFRYIDPPFQFNSPEIAAYPVEVTGFHLLSSLRQRLGWNSLAGKRLLDFGCGVRFARTIHNLDIDIGSYTGIDVNAQAIAWLANNADDPRFRFEHFDMRNEMYNAGGETVEDRNVLQRRGFSEFDAACMFSVITHQAPADAQTIFALLYETVRARGQLYFTAFTDDGVDQYREGDPALPCILSTYHPEYLRQLVSSAGWNVEEIYPKTNMQQTAFVCRK